MNSKTPLGRKDKIWETLSILLLLAHALVIARTLPSLPDQVAIHFNSQGLANGWGNKNSLWLPFGLSILMYVFLTFVSIRPGFYKWRMKEKNLDAQYQLTSKMARTAKAFIILAFITLSVFMLKSAQGVWTKQMPFLFLILFALIVPPCLYYAVKFAKIR